MRRKLSLTGAVLAAVAGLAALGIDRGWWRANEPDPREYPTWGIDVSHHQGHIDWATVAANPHLAFAWIKATEGGDWVDPRFRENWQRARAAGLAVGAYHFFTFCRPGADQARHFLAVLPRDPDALAPAVDVEFGGNCARPPPAEVVTRELDTWLRLVEEALGRRPVVYATREAYDAFLAGAPRGPIWIRSIWTTPDRPRDWAIWQFDARARLRGIDGPVDLDVFRGPREALARL